MKKILLGLLLLILVGLVGYEIRENVQLDCTGYTDVGNGYSEAYSQCRLTVFQWWILHDLGLVKQKGE